VATALAAPLVEAGAEVVVVDLVVVDDVLVVDVEDFVVLVLVLVVDVLVFVVLVVVAPVLCKGQLSLYNKYLTAP
jgi:hypothetical protein